MEHLLSCHDCRHGAVSHETTGCTYSNCDCKRTLPALIEEALEAARVEMRREWDVAS